MYRIIISFCLIIVFMFSIMSCGTKTKDLKKEEISRIESQKVIWITTKDGAELELKNPKIQGSKIVGTYYGNVREVGISDILLVKVKKIGFDETIVLATAAGATGTALFIGCLTAPSEPSCGPFIYSFDRKEYVLDSEPYSGAILKERTGYTKLNHLAPINGKYNFIMTNELNETQYTDEIKLLVVEYPTNIDILPDVTGEIHTISFPVSPVSAYELPETDILDLVKTKDDKLWGNDPAYDPDIVFANTYKELMLEFPKPRNAKTAKLVINVSNTWYCTYKGREFLDCFGSLYPVMGFVRSFARKGFIRFGIEVWENGKWKRKGEIRGASPYLPLDRIAIFDVSSIEENSLKLRFTLADNFWRINSVAVNYNENFPIRVIELEASKASDNKGRNIRELLRRDDDDYYVTEKGDYATITFNEPSPIPGRERSFVLKARGCYKIHTIEDEKLTSK